MGMHTKKAPVPGSKTQLLAAATCYVDLASPQAPSQDPLLSVDSYIIRHQPAESTDISRWLKAIQYYNENSGNDHIIAFTNS